MYQVLVSLVAGLVFGLGLAIAGMIDPAIVLGFLDIAGAWNPTLAFVMASGVAVTFVGYRLVYRMNKPLLAETFSQPASTTIDKPLLIGAALFGIGWGLAGYCPGPALSSLLSGNIGVLIFVVAMLIGMTAVRSNLFTSFK